MNSIFGEIFQHAVGQGGFHHECLRVRSHHLRGEPEQTFNVIFDCGGNLRRLGEVINRTLWGAWTGSACDVIDVLVLSHLHHDHINGFKELVGGARPVSIRRLIIPLYDDRARLVLLARVAAETGSPDAVAETDAVVSSNGQWFRDRGVEAVIQVRRDDGDVPPPRAPEGSTDPDSWGPLDEGDKDRGSWSHLSHRLDLTTLRGTLREPNNLSISGEFERDQIFEMRSGSVLRLALNAHKRILTPWTLIPYCRDQDHSPELDSYVAKISSILTPYRRGNGRLVFSKATGSQVIKDLTNAFSTYAGRNRRLFNELSVSIYSGMMERRFWVSTSVSNPLRLSDRKHISVRAVSPGLEPEQFHTDGEPSEGYGWILTGDSDLSNCRDKWFGFFGPLSRHAVVFQLPHHGSRHNISDLSALKPTMLHFATANFGDWSHPHRDVRKLVKKDGRRLHVVTKSGSTMLSSSVLAYF